MAKIITWLFYAIYGTRNCVSVCGKGETSSHISMSIGEHDDLGDRDTDVFNGKNTVNFLGLDSCWCNLGFCLDNVRVNYPKAVITDTQTGVSKTLDIGIGECEDVNIYVTSVMAGDDMDLFGVNFYDLALKSPIGYCTSSGFNCFDNSDAVLTWGSNNMPGLPYDEAGSLAALKQFPLSDNSNEKLTRLAYRGKITVMSDIEEFKALPLL